MQRGEIIRNLVRSFSSFKLFAFILLSTSFLRVIYGIVVVDPMSGPDSITYFEARNDLRLNGLFGDAFGVPFWPVGYPWLLFFVSLLFGPDLVWVSIVQTLLWSISVWLFTKFLKDSFNAEIAYVTGILLSVNPALSGASVQLMYEVPQISLIMIGLYFATRRTSIPRLMVFYQICSLLALIFAICMQPKTIVAIVSLLIISLSQHNRSLGRSFLFILSIFLGYFTLLLRNIIAGNGAMVSSNYSAHVIAGINQVNPKFDPGCIASQSGDTFAYILCLQSSKLRNPALGIEVSINNLIDVLAPYIGNLGNGMLLGGTGTWWHAFDTRRLFVLYDFMDQGSIYWYLDRIFSLLWMFSLILLVAYGFRILTKIGSSLSTSVAQSFLLATIALLLIPVLGFGDSRYRMGAMPFYTVFIAASLYTFLSNFTEKKITGLKNYSSLD